jgi:hypothetical protein
MKHSIATAAPVNRHVGKKNDEEFNRHAEII